MPAGFLCSSNTTIEIFYVESNLSNALPEKSPNTEFFLVRIFLYLDWIWTRKNSVFGYFSRSDGF